MKTNLFSYSRSFQILIIATIVLGVFFRFANLDKKIYWIDEVHSSLRVAGYHKQEFVDNAPAGRILTIEELHQFQRLSPDRGWGDTINALAGNAEHTPLYYLMTRIWMQWFGSSPTVTRSLAAVISLLVFPCLYWLCLELFNSAIVGWIAIALVAVSPLHVLYAQEARQYTLFAVAVLLSSTALLRSLRLQVESSPFIHTILPLHTATQIQKQTIFNWKFYLSSWGVYAATVAFSLYSHLISLLFLISHGLYVAIAYRIPRALKNYAIASWIGLMTLLPWIVLYFINSSKIGGWVSRDIPIVNLVRRWILNLTAVFLDIQIGNANQLINVETGQDLSLNYSNPWLYAIPPILILVGYAIYFICCRAPKQRWLFIVTLIGTTSLALMFPDVISGGQRSSIARYLMPAYLGIEIAVAYLLATKLHAYRVSKLERKLWQLAFVAVLAGGIISCTVSSQAETWWNKYSCYYNAEVAGIINQAKKPLVIVPRERVSRLLSLSYKLDPETKLLLVEGTNLPPITDGFDELFLFRTSADLYEGIEENSPYLLQPLHPFGHIWRLEVKN